eukprot:Partr_v1_DN26887_c3_g1_i4_m40539 putative o-acyltransferase
MNRDRSHSVSTHGRSRKPVFTARVSLLDTASLTDTFSHFRGFIVLFWVCLALTMVNLFVANYRVEGTPFKLDLFHLFAHDIQALFWSDLGLLASTFLCLPLHWVLRKRWISLSVSILLQILFQIHLLLVPVWWTLKRQYNWPQTAAFNVHALSMLLKVHSYIANNRDMEIKSRLLHAIMAKQKRDESASPEITAQIDVLKADLSIEYDGVVVEYPSNFTLWNFVDFLMIPTFLYQISYPRTKNIRFAYILEKIVACAGIVTIMYFIIEHVVFPVMSSMGPTSESVIETVMQLLIPFTIMWLMLFYVTFECVCNTFAELTRFADREFYQDWWNSITYDEFARKWNKPVHEFLLRHVYHEVIDSYRMSKVNAMFLTFLFSACLHELVVGMVSRKISFVFFFCQMSQIPLMWLGKSKLVRDRPLIANAFFWVSLLSGLPTITILYTRDIFSRTVLAAREESWWSGIWNGSTWNR